MAGMKFEYDENGAKFVYFILSFYAMVIIPATFYLWPRKQVKKTEHAEEMSCYEPCQRKLRLLNKNEPRKKLVQTITKIILIVGWIIFAYLAYKASQIEIEHKEYDPFGILGVDRGATDQEIKKKYRELSKTMHPDRGGDEDKFKELAKAYQALTNEETKKNWIEYGNPDGPGVTQFGIALPKWIVDGKNSYLVLGAYVLVFMIIMPIIVGTWWYKSIKYTGDQVLIMTTKVFNYFLMQSPQMNLKKIIMVLSTSKEFERYSNPEVVERPSDNVEVPQLISQIPEMQEKSRELPYCLKARALIYAHLSRFDLPENTLLHDKNVVVKKCPMLINELINIASSLVQAENANYLPKNIHAPKLDTIENMMKLSPMIVQALWNKSKSNLLQLPHLEENHLRHFITKKRNISNIKQFVQSNDADRRSILRHLSDEQYDDIMRVCSYYPHVEMTWKVNIVDDEDEHTVTAGALVTLLVNLKRESLKVLLGNEDAINAKTEQDEETSKEEANGEAVTTEANQKNADKKPKPWEKQKKKTKAAKAKSKPAKNAKPKSKNSNDTKESKEEIESDKDAEDENDADETNENDENNQSDNNQSDNDEETSLIKNKSKSTEKKSSSKSNKSSSNDDDEYFERFQQMQKKKEKLEAKSKISHRVYSPHFPDIKQECWWLYLADRKANILLSSPIYICTLKDTEEFELKFLAPKKTGMFTYSLILRSDSYLDFDIIQNVKLDVHPAKKIDDHPQWNFTDDEAAKNGDDDEMDDEFTTESENDD